MRARCVEEGLQPPKKRVLIRFPEQQLEISEEERELYKPFEKDEYMLRLITGANHENCAQRSLIRYEMGTLRRHTSNESTRTNTSTNARDDNTLDGFSQNVGLPPP